MTRASERNRPAIPVRGPWLLTTAWVVAVFLLAGCSEREGESHAPGMTVRESLGILIVENSSPAQSDGSLWELSPAPMVEIGSTDEADPALLFSQVRSLDRQSDGSIVVVDGLSNEVRIFDRSGRHLSTSGGSGTGPGEFTMANLIVGLPGDSILVHDQILARLSLFRPDGTHERTEQLTGLPGFSPFMTPLGLAPDGALIVRGVHEPPPPRFGPGLVEATAYLADLDEGRMDALAGVPFALGATDEQGQPRPVFPMAVPIQAVSPGGLWVTLPPEPEIKKTGWSGSVERIVRFPEARLALTSEEQRGVVAWQRARSHHRFDL